MTFIILTLLNFEMFVGILSGFSLQKDFNMVRYKAALESSKSQWIFSQLPFGASTFISPPELKGILHIDDYALLGEGN